MSPISLVITLAVIGVLLWLLTVFGVIGHIGDIRVPRLGR